MKITKHLINDVLEKIIYNYEYKCAIYEQKYVINSFKQIAKEYGFEFKKGEKGDRIAFTLIDYEHKVNLIFTKQFIKEKLIDYKNNGDNYINLEDVFKPYGNLPDKVKDSINIMWYDKINLPINLEDGTIVYADAAATFLSRFLKETHIIYVPDYLFSEKHRNEKYDLLLDELIKIINEVKRKRVVFLYWRFKGNTFGNYYNYDLFGEKSAIMNKKNNRSYNEYLK